jgi:hypothetical protein
MRARYGEKLRKFLRDNSKILKIINFGGVKVFDATVDTVILQTEKDKAFENWQVEFVNVKDDYKKGSLFDYLKNKKQLILQKDLNDNTWTLENEQVLALKKKIETIGIPLKNWGIKIYRGVLTGFNDAFIIDSRKRGEILNNCNDNQERKKTEEIIKPILRGRDIYRWGYKWAGLWLIKIESGWTNKNRGKENPEDFFKKTFPSVYFYLKKIGNEIHGKGKGLCNRDDRGDYWWELRDCNYYEKFGKEKIIYPEMSEKNCFVIDNKGFYILDTCWFINGKWLKYILSIINSKLFLFIFKQISYSLSEKALRWKKIFIEQQSIPKIPESDQQPFIVLVDKILTITKDENYLENSAKQSKVREYEKQIDQMVYKLYGLTPEEIKIVEGKNENN